MNTPQPTQQTNPKQPDLHKLPENSGGDKPPATIPEILRGIAPEIGSVWEWEPLKSYARELLRVTNVTWNGEECLVESEPMKRNVYYNPDPNRDRVWNTLSRWVEATVYADIPDDHVRPLGSDIWP